jgi:molecular chaperone GrpE
MNDTTNAKARDEAPVASEAEAVPPEAEAPVIPQVEEPPLPEIDPKDVEIAALKEEAGQTKDRLLRLAAEMDNLRKRLEREKAEATLYAATNFARELLPVADSLSRALAAVSPEERDAADEVTKNLLVGVEVTERELQNVFAKHGIRRLQPMGEKFDPHMHQAMFEVPSSSEAPGTVVEVVQDGYAIGERCLRPALVGVAKAG